MVYEGLWKQRIENTASLGCFHPVSTARSVSPFEGLSCVKEPLRRLGRISTGSGTGGIARSEDSHGADNLVGGQCGTSGAESLADDRILFQTQRWVLSGGKEPFRFICESDPAE